MNKRELTLAVFSVSFAMLINEIMLTSIFHVIIGQPNTILAISITMLGLSFSGMVIYMLPVPKIENSFQKSSYSLLLWFTAATIVSTIVIMNLPINHGDFFYSRKIGTNLLRLVIYIFGTVPFFVGGLFINLAFYVRSDQISKLYFSNLLGAAFGCALSFPLMELFGAPNAIICASALVLLLPYGILFSKKPFYKATIFIFVLFLLVEIISVFTPLLNIKKLNTLGNVNSPHYRSFLIHKGDIEFEKWASDSWTIVRSDRIPQQWTDFKGWGLSKNYKGAVPRIKLVNFNSRFTTYITEFNSDFSKIGEWLDSDLISLHYLLGRNYSKVLNIGAGGGREVLNALNHNAKEITAVDISETTFNNIMKRRFKEFSGFLYFNPKVKTVVDDGRIFIRRTAGKFDLIDFAIAGGANIEKLELINPDSLFMIESLQLYMDHLEDDGVFSYTMYNFDSRLIDVIMTQPSYTEDISYAYIPAVKTLAGLRMVFEKTFPSERFKDHILISGIHGVIDKKYDLVHIIMSKGPFSETERQRFLKKCRELGFVIFYPEDHDNIYSKLAKAGSIESFARRLPFDIYPPNDNKPFQYNFTWQKIRGGIFNKRFFAKLFNDPIILNSFYFGIFSLLFLVGPLALRRLKKDHFAYPFRAWRMLLFFALIGCSYMMIEIAILLKLQLYLGNPMLAISVALFALLFSSGLGSYLTKYFHDRAFNNAVSYSIVGLCFFGLFLFFYWSTIATNSIILPVLLRIIIAIAVIFPLGIFMGMFFPMGIKSIARTHTDMIPWILAINGCFSISSLFTSRILALFWGFNAVFILGLFLYLLASGFILWHLKLENLPHIQVSVTNQKLIGVSHND